MRKIDELYTDDPSRGSRSIRRQLKRQGIRVNRKRIQRLMRLMGIGRSTLNREPPAAILAIRSIPICSGIWPLNDPIKCGRRILPISP